MPAAPTELLLPSERDLPAAVALLRGRLTIESENARSDERGLLDTFDGRLRGAGARAELRGGELAIHEAGAPVRRAQGGDRRSVLAAGLPAGGARARPPAL